MNDKDGGTDSGAADADADKQDVAAAMLNSAEWREKLAAAREARAKVLAARTTDPERKLKEALAKTAAAEVEQEEASKDSTPIAPMPAEPPRPAPAPMAEPQPAPLQAEPAQVQPAARTGSPRLAVGFVIGLIIGLAVGAVALAVLWFAEPESRPSVILRDALSQVLGEQPRALPPALEISPAPAELTRAVPLGEPGLAGPVPDAAPFGETPSAIWLDAEEAARILDATQADAANGLDASTPPDGLATTLAAAANAKLSPDAPGAKAAEAGSAAPTVPTADVHGLPPSEDALPVFALEAERADAVESAVERLQALAPQLAKLRVVLHARAHRAELQAFLDSVGFASAETPETSFVAARTLVHFFDPRDAAVAADLAIVLGGEPVNLTGFQPTPDARRLDVYLAETS